MKLKIAICMALMLLSSVSALAKEQIWYNKYSGLDKCKKIVVFPIEGEYEFLQANDVLGNDTEKRIKGVVFTLLTRNSQENLIMQSNEALDYLRNTAFASEQERGRAVKEKTNADFYLVCRVRQARIQKDWSPEITEYVNLKSYTEESGGPDGYKTYDTSYRTESYTVPGQYVYLHLLDLDYTLYNKSGEKVLLFANRRYGYGTSEENQFKECLKDFAVAFRKARKECGKRK